MALRILLYEVRYWLSQPMVYIFLLINALMVFGAVTTENIQIGGSIGSVYRNAPEVVYNFYGVMSFIGILMVTAFVNGSAIRDFQYNMAGIIFSTPITRAQYLLGKFFGATFVALLPMLGISLGIVVGSWMPWLDAERIGPNMLGPHLQGFFLICAPNVLFSAALIFVVAVLSRSTIASFITAIVLIVGYSIAQNLMSDIDNEQAAALLDPFGMVALDKVTKYWTVSEKNSNLLPVAGLLLWNRVLWVAGSLLIFGIGYLRFNFHERRQKGSTKVVEVAPVHVPAGPLPSVDRTYGGGARLRQFAHQVRVQLKAILTGPVFIIVMLLGGLQLFFSLKYVTEMYGNITYPVTYNVADMISGSLFLYVIIIVTFYSGALVWRERDPRMHDISDALPVPTWLGIVTKFTTMMVLLLMVWTMATGAGMITQLLNGYTNFEPGVYLWYLIVPGTLSFGFLAMLAICIHTLVNNKYLGFFAFIVVVILNTFIWSAFDIDSNLVQLNGSSGLRYSDMAGFGAYVPAWIFFKTYWWVFGGILLLIAFLFHVRGRETGARWRLSTAGLRLRRNRLLALGLLAGWLVLGAWGWYNTKHLNTYMTSDVQEELMVRYEKEFKKYEGIPQPHYLDIAFTIDLRPQERELDYLAEVLLHNPTAAAIDSVHLILPEHMKIELELPGELVLHDEDLKYRIYRLNEPLAPGAELRMNVKGRYAIEGFENRLRFYQIQRNGTFFNNMDLLPVIGYSTDGEMSDRNDRRKYGLPPKEPMPRLSEDPEQRMHTYLVPNSNWVTVRTTISTDPDQIAVAPGSLKKEWEADGRRYFSYELDHPSMNFYSFMSARYAVAREQWTEPETGEIVDLEVYYHPSHEVNVPRMLNSMRRSLTYYSQNFGPYRHKQARIVEFPRYASFAQAFPGTMPYSESIGFITDLSRQEDIDMVFYVVAHEMGHQWWAHQVVGTDMQGATLLSESMSQYSALMVMEEEYGRPHMRKFMKHESDKYQRARGSETKREVPLLEVENQGYIHYNKGSVVLYNMREFIGEEKLNSAFKALVDSFAYGEPPYPTALDMYRELQAVTPDSLTYLLEDNFKRITLYNNRLLSATGRELKDGIYEVTVALTAEKNHADTLGRETPVPMNDWIDIGFFDAPADGKKDGELLSKHRERIVTGENSFIYRLPKKPAQAAIDPDHLFFDRVMEDNLRKVEWVVL